MNALSELLTLCQGGSTMVSPHNGPAMQSFDVFFTVDMNKLLKKQ